MHWFEEKIILASQSPRRRELLQMAGFQIEVRPISVDERFPAGLPVEEVAGYIAEIKAQAARHLAAPNEILLTADSVVALDGEVYGKPEDFADGVRILRALSGKKHQVYTGVCLQKAGKKRTFTGVSHVYFSELNEEEIDYYLREYKPYDKAGAYAIQEWIGLCKVIKIEGSYSNIVGLPMELVYKELRALTAAER